MLYIRALITCIYSRLNISQSQLFACWHVRWCGNQWHSQAWVSIQNDIWSLGWNWCQLCHLLSLTFTGDHAVQIFSHAITLAWIQNGALFWWLWSRQFGILRISRAGHVWIGSTHLQWPASTCRCILRFTTWWRAVQKSVWSTTCKSSMERYIVSITLGTAYHYYAYKHASHAHELFPFIGWTRRLLWSCGSVSRKEGVEGATHDVYHLGNTKC